jgi:quercetin dioxygenase-like cupin family protein
MLLRAVLSIPASSAHSIGATGKKLPISRTGVRDSKQAAARKREMKMAEDGWVFLRGVVTNDYSLKSVRREQLASPRVRTNDIKLVDGTIGDDAIIGHHHSAHSRAWWHLAPGDNPFLTQTLEMHFVELPPGSSNHGHGHQNEAPFFVLEGAGYDIHDGIRYDWSAGDLLSVHTDSVHKHYNPYDKPALMMTYKAKSTWMFLGLLQQGHGGDIEDEDKYGPRVDWTGLWTPGVEKLAKIVHSEEVPWENTPLGRVRILTAPTRPDVRLFSVDMFILEIPAGSRSGRRWQMADEALFVLSGSGYSLHWDVQADLDDRYYARIAKEPSRHDIKKGDTLFIPPNTVAQHFASDGEPLRLLSSQNRAYKVIGYDNTVFLEHAPPPDGA